MILTCIPKELGYVLICALPLAFYNTAETGSYVGTLPETHGIRLEYNRTTTTKKTFHFKDRISKANPRQIPPDANKQQDNGESFALLCCPASIMSSCLCETRSTQSKF